MSSVEARTKGVRQSLWMLVGGLRQAKACRSLWRCAWSETTDYPPAVPEIKKAEVDLSKFNADLVYPYELRQLDFQAAIQDVYDFFHDVNTYLLGKGLQRLEDMMRPANLSGTLSDMITDSLGNKSRILTTNLHHNGHPDLLVRDRYPGNAISSGVEGVEIKCTRKPGGAVDTHGARAQTMCTWVYAVDNDRSKAAHEREPLIFREIYIATVGTEDFRKNPRGELGTRTATLDKTGIRKYRAAGWVYLDLPSRTLRRRQTAQQVDGVV